MTAATVKISLRLDHAVHATLERVAREEALSTEALIQRILTRHATECARDRALLHATEIDRLEREQRIYETAVRRARELDEAGAFDEHFTLTVMRDLMSDPDFRAEYESAVGGDAYRSGLPGKSPLNMYLGWYIKNAVADARPLRDANHRPRRRQVRDEPIQSYTLLTKS